MNIARALNNNGKYEEAYSIASNLKNKGDTSSDSILQEESLLLMGLTLTMMGRDTESLENYAAAFHLNPDLLTSNDIKLISTAIARTNPDSISPDLNNFIVKMSSSDDYRISYSVLANQGKYEEAYKELEAYKNQQDSVINMIIHSNVMESLSQYETNRKNLELADSHIKHLVTILILITIILVCVVMVWLLRERLRKNEIAKLKAENNLKSTGMHLAQEMNKKQALIDCLSNVARERYESVNEAFDSYFRKQDSGNVKKITDAQIKKIVKEFNDDIFLQDVGKIVDKYVNGIFSSFKEDFPNLNEDSLRLFLYFCIGLTNHSVSIILDQGIDVIYNRKSRLKTKVRESDSLRKADYLKMFK